jgi:hypothetical protein
MRSRRCPLRGKEVPTRPIDFKIISFSSPSNLIRLIPPTQPPTHGFEESNTEAHPQLTRYAQGKRQFLSPQPRRRTATRHHGGGAILPYIHSLGKKSTPLVLFFEILPSRIRHAKAPPSRSRPPVPPPYACHAPPTLSLSPSLSLLHVHSPPLPLITHHLLLLLHLLLPPLFPLNINQNRRCAS